MFFIFKKQIIYFQLHIVTQTIYITIPKGRNGDIGNPGPKQDWNPVTMCLMSKGLAASAILSVLPDTYIFHGLVIFLVCSPWWCLLILVFPTSWGLQCSPVLTLITLIGFSRFLCRYFPGTRLGLSSQPNCSLLMNPSCF